MARQRQGTYMTERLYLSDGGGDDRVRAGGGGAGVGEIVFIGGEIVFINSIHIKATQHRHFSPLILNWLTSSKFIIIYLVFLHEY